MTKGEPYYSKFGFKSGSSPINVRNNKEHWKTNPMLSKKVIGSILNKNIDINISKNKELHDTMIKSFEKFKNNNISISEYCNYLYELAENKELQLDVIRQKYIKKAKGFDKINIYFWLIVILLNVISLLVIGLSYYFVNIM